MTRSTERFRDKRETILDGAARQFNLHGVRGAMISDIAAGVGLATNSLTYYYRKKEDLVAACLHRSIEVMGAAADAAATESTLAGRVHGFFGHYFAVLAEIAQGRHPELIVFSDLLSVPPPHAAPLLASYTQLFRRVRRLLDAADGPRLAPAARNARAHLLLSTVAWARTWLPRHEPQDHPRVAARLSDLLLLGLTHDQRRPGVASGVMPAGLADDAARPNAAIRSAYLRAATRLVNEHGYQGASVDRIAAELQLTKGSFYHHHETKEDLIVACFERTFTVMRAAQDAALDARGSGLDRLALACRLLLAFQTSAQGPLLRVTAWAGLPDGVRIEMRRAMDRLGERFGTLVIDGMSDGSMRVLDPSMAAQVISGMVNAAAELQRWAPGLDEAQSFELYALALFTGLQAAAPAGVPAQPRATPAA